MRRGGFSYLYLILLAGLCAVVVGTVLSKNQLRLPPNNVLVETPKPSITNEQVDLTTPQASTQPTSFIRTEATKNWLIYTNDKYEFMTFLYPEGSTITFEDETNLPIEGCFLLKLAYKKMVLDVYNFCGIGGLPRLYDAPYTIISGNDYKGVGRAITDPKTPGYKSVRYFGYKRGGMQFGGFLTGTASFTFTFPSIDNKTYEPIADLIATSVLHVIPNQKYTPTKMYQKEESVIGVKPDWSEYIIFSADNKSGEYIEFAVINPALSYVAIKTHISKEITKYLYIYNFEKERLEEIDGSTRLVTSGGEPPIWSRDYTFVDFNDGEYYQYDVKNLTRQKITRREYSEVMEY